MTLAAMYHATVPAAPGWALDWAGITEALPEIAALAGCPQNPVYHGEGDVWIHTRMVVEGLIDDPAWRALEECDRRVSFWTAVLHDIGKPAMTKEINGRLTSHGHARRGAQMARVMLWQADVAPEERERICALIDDHMQPFFALERRDPQRLALSVSVRARCDLLVLQALADARGRIAADKQRIIDNVLLFRELAAENKCLTAPFGFASDHARVGYFEREGRDPHWAAHDDTWDGVTLMSGLPGAGKDRWVETKAAGLPVISLDRLRHDMGIAPGRTPGELLSRARDEARALLRRREPFVWNATNLKRDLRGKLIALFRDYDARVRIVHVEAPSDRLHRQNRARDAIVPDDVITQMLARWQPPDLTEAHEVVHVVEGV